MTKKRRKNQSDDEKQALQKLRGGGLAALDNHPRVKVRNDRAGQTVLRIRGPRPPKKGEQ